VACCISDVHEDEHPATPGPFDAPSSFQNQQQRSGGFNPAGPPSQRLFQQAGTAEHDSCAPNYSQRQQTQQLGVGFNPAGPPSQRLFQQAGTAEHDSCAPSYSQRQQTQQLRGSFNPAGSAMQHMLEAPSFSQYQQQTQQLGGGFSYAGSSMQHRPEAWHTRQPSAYMGNPPPQAWQGHQSSALSSVHLSCQVPLAQFQAITSGTRMGMLQEAPAAEVPDLPALSEMATVKKLYQLYHDGNPMYRTSSLKAMAKDGKPKNWCKRRWGEVKNFEALITETAKAHGISGLISGLVWLPRNVAFCISQR
jgi:hypothetical protein